MLFKMKQHRTYLWIVIDENMNNELLLSLKSVLFYMYKCSAACMQVHHIGPEEARTGFGAPRMELRAVMSCHVNTGN